MSNALATHRWRPSWNDSCRLLNESAYSSRGRTEEKSKFCRDCSCLLTSFLKQSPHGFLRCHRWWHMDVLLCAGNQATTKGKNSFRCICFKECKIGPIGYNFLRFEENNPYGPLKNKNARLQGSITVNYGTDFKGANIKKKKFKLFFGWHSKILSIMRYFSA